MITCRAMRKINERAYFCVLTQRHQEAHEDGTGWYWVDRRPYPWRMG